MDRALAATRDDVIERLALDAEALEALCRANGVRQLALFGSAVRDDFDAERSDLDLLVTIEAPTAATYADHYFALREGLERLAGRHIDLVTERSIENPYLRRHIIAEKVTLYSAPEGLVEPIEPRPSMTSALEPAQSMRSSASGG